MLPAAPPGLPTDRENPTNIVSWAASWRRVVGMHRGLPERCLSDLSAGSRVSPGTKSWGIAEPTGILCR